MKEKTRLRASKSKKRRPADSLDRSRLTRTRRTSVEERHRLIAEDAYCRAAGRGFRGGDPLQDWLEAEAAIDARLVQGADEGVS